MLKSYRNSAAALALVVAASAFLAMPSQRVSAQSDGPAVFAVDLDIAPAELDKYLAAVRENGAATIKEPGCREYNIMVSATNPNHVFIFEVYENDTAAQAHRASEHFKKYRATTANMVTAADVRPMKSVAFNLKAH
jgi:quinol monooxygenase YgiN